MDLNNHLFLKFIAKKNASCFINRYGTLDEIESAVKILVSNGQKNICILHCVSLYPLDHKVANLKNISMLRKKFKYIPIGYSDHSIGTTLPISSIALGACIIEKHFTLDNKKIGMDNHMATEPSDMMKMISESQIAFIRLVMKRESDKKEIDQRKKCDAVYSLEIFKKKRKLL